MQKLLKQLLTRIKQKVYINCRNLIQTFSVPIFNDSASAVLLAWLLCVSPTNALYHLFTPCHTHFRCLRSRKNSIILELNQKQIGLTLGIRKKKLFFSGLATKAYLPPPPSPLALKNKKKKDNKKS